MRKYADKYFVTDKWKIIEEGFDPERSLVSESVFSLGNEYMGLRGYFEEGYSGSTLQGSYINGVFERRQLRKSGYKGIPDCAEYMVNTVDWQYARINGNGTRLDLAKCDIEGFRRELDMRTGVLTRSFIWRLDEKTRLRLCFERFLSMEKASLGGQRISFELLEGELSLVIEAGLDFSKLHMSAEQNHWQCREPISEGSFCAIMGTTASSGQSVYSSAYFEGMTGEAGNGSNLKKAVNIFRAELKSGESRTLTRIASIKVGNSDCSDKKTALEQVKSELMGYDYDALKRESAMWWDRQWESSDIEIKGDDETAQGIRYCIFQMHQTLHTAGHSAIVGAKGLTGEAYNGNSFWDTEVYCLPFYIFNNPAAAETILRFRYDTLPEAKARARQLDLEGAYYPLATISGIECCDLWQHANLQLQPSTSVAYGIWNYTHISKNKDFLYQMGAEILIEICRMLATRGNYSGKTGKYGYYGVMGPDEFQMMVNNNCYTNFMAQKTFLYTLEVLSEMEAQVPQLYLDLIEKTRLDPKEPSDWREKAEKMLIIYDEETKLFEQHDGFFDLPHVDLKSIPVEDFPLYHNWSYDRIYRNDMIKQPDVLMFMYMYISEFTKAQIEANFDYYEPRCIHESSLSPSVHSILALAIGRPEKAYELFRFAIRMDLDNYNRNTGEGLHTTSIAGSWLNIVYGYGGLRSDGSFLSLYPLLPEQWESYSFNLMYQGRLIRVSVDKEGCSLSLAKEGSLEISVYGQRVLLTDKTCRAMRPPR